MSPALFVTAALAGVTPEVAEGTYLWQTGQDEAAAEVARAAVEADDQDLAAFRLNAAIVIARGDGAALEADTREWWSESTKDPVRRTALALVLAQRNTEKGGWCDEVITLVRPVTEGEPHYWATIADRMRALRCVGETDHADAELRRIAKEGGIGWADGVLAELEAGYIKEDLPDRLERVWTEQPWRLARASALWRDNVAGPGKGAARNVTNRALADAAESDDRVLVHAALLAWRGADEPKKAEAAALRLASLDPAADTSLVRDLDDVSDPPEYAAIRACTQARDPADIVSCLDALTLPEEGSLTAWREVQRARALTYAGRDDEAYAALRAAWEADRSHRFNARTFARAALARGVDFELGVEAAEAFVDDFDPSGRPAAVLEFPRAGGTPAPTEMAADVASLPEARRSALAKDLDLLGGLLLGAGRPDEALARRRLAWTLEPTPARQIRLGVALAAAGQADEAVLHLAHGLALEADDTALVSLGRDTLRPLATAWGATVSELVAQAARLPGDEDAPRSPLVGAPFAAPDLLPAHADPKKPGVRVVVAWASWRPEVAATLSRIAAIEKHYADEGVRFRSLGVDSSEVPPPADAPADTRWIGPSALRQLRTVALPVVVVVNAKGKIASVLAPYDRSSLDLEKAIDALLPSP